MFDFKAFLRTKTATPVISYKNLRRLIGILGMLLPAVCYLGGLLVEELGLGPSISSYYYTNVRDVFVGIMIGVSMFLVTYRGYEYIDDIVSTVTGIAGLGIAIFPCLNAAVAKAGFFQLPTEVSNIYHSVCAGLFFFLLAMNSMFIFTMTDPKAAMTPKKKIRNAIYIGAGVVILLCLAMLGFLHWKYTQEELDAKVWVFILETVLLEAFGISWLVKGDTLFRD